MTQAASYRLAIAVRYWHGARVILENEVRPLEHMEPVGFLLGMAAELALKSYLIDANFTEVHLSKKLGHDLTASLRSCIENGLRISEIEASCIVSMREAHLSHFNRYGPKMADGKLMLGAFLTTDQKLSLQRVAMLIDHVAQDPMKLRKMHGHSANLNWPGTPRPMVWVDLQKLADIEDKQRQSHKKIEDLNDSMRKAGTLPPFP